MHIFCPIIYIRSLAIKKLGHSNSELVVTQILQYSSFQQVIPTDSISVKGCFLFVTEEILHSIMVVFWSRELDQAPILDS